jgi:2Fe-2S ferredoxin
LSAPPPLPPLPQQQRQKRHLARGSGGPVGGTPYEKAVAFVVAVGHEPAVARGVVDALRESGLSGEALLAAARRMAGRWEVGEDEGLEALAASVRQALAEKEGRSVVTFKVVPPTAWRSAEGQEDYQETADDRERMMKRAFDVEALEGLSITDVAKFGTGKGASTLGEFLECACSGIMACSTCHVVLEPAWFAAVGPPCDAEQDMLDLAYSCRSTSRLGCQIVLTKELDGMIIRLPAGANNLMDFVPFQD